MKLADHIRGKSRFQFFRNGVFYYATDTGMEFRIPVDDVDGATLNAEDKSIMFLRWIRRTDTENQIAMTAPPVTLP